MDTEIYLIEGYDKWLSPYPQNLARSQFYTNLLCFDVNFSYPPHGDECKIYRYLPSGMVHPKFDDRIVDRGQGNFIYINSYQATRPWTNVIPGNFGGEYGGLLFYDGQSGTAEFDRMHGKGNITFLKSYNNFSKNWSKIIPIPFGFRTDLLFYNKSKGYGEVYNINSKGDMELLKCYNNLNRTWTHIVPIQVENDFRGPYLLFYNPSGYAELYRIDGLGELKFIDKSKEFNSNWTHIVSVPAYMPPPIYRIRVQAIVTSDDAPGGVQTTFVPNQFEMQDIQNLINGANKYFKEAGIHFDFDPNTDIDEIPSRILYNAKAVDTSGRILPNENEHYFDPGTGKDLGSTHSTRGVGLYEGEISLFQLGWRYRGKLVIVFSKTEVNYSTVGMEYVMFNKVRDTPIGASFAHEVGHYLGLIHTFNYIPKTRSEIQDIIISHVKKLLKDKNYAKTDDEVNSIIKNGKIPEEILKNGYNIFDCDRLANWRDVKDTSNDLGEPTYEIPPNIPCTDSLNIEVVFSEYQRKTYEFKPDVRKNAMSYGFRKCGCRFSPGQVHVMRKGLREKNRRQLVPVYEFEFGLKCSEDKD